MIKDQTYALLPWLSHYCFDTVVRLRNLDIDSGHSEELPQGLQRQFYGEESKESEEEDKTKKVGRITSVDRVEVLLRPKRI